jgi:hypothetical protein
MIQALHIFRKDVRRFAYEIGVLVALTALWAWSHSTDFGNLPHTMRFADIANVLLPLSWWYVISQLIHEEPLTGDRQFWITRPYSRVSLLSSKALFILCFINLPLLFGGLAILGVAGYQPLRYLPNFLWMQFTFTAAVLLLPVALASLTRTLVQFVLTVLGLIVGFLMLGLIFGKGPVGGVYQSPGLAWVAGIRMLLSVVVATLAVVLLQLRRRNRLISAGAGVGMVVLFVLPDYSLDLRIGAATQARTFGEKGTESVTVAVGTPRMAGNHSGTLDIPFRIAQIPDAQTAAPELIELEFVAPGGRHWSSGWIPVASSEASVFQTTGPSPDGSFTWKQHVVVDHAFWQDAHSGPVTIRGAVYIMLNSRHSIRLHDQGVTAIPGDGHCTVDDGLTATCRAPFHQPFNSFETAPLRLLSWWDSPFPADFGMNPLSTNAAGDREAREVTFVRYDPCAYVLRPFTGLVEPSSRVVPSSGARGRRF